MIWHRQKKYRRGRRRSRSMGYVQIVFLSLLLIAVASFYIYQRVWVHNLVIEVDDWEKINKETQENLANLESEWRQSISLAVLENRIDELNLKIRPTLPSQNLALLPVRPDAHDRFGGLARAFDKLKSHLPFIEPTEAEAEELFEEAK